MEEASVRRLNGLQLAFIGDTVYDLYARGRALEEHDGNLLRGHGRGSVLLMTAEGHGFDDVLTYYNHLCEHLSWANLGHVLAGGTHSGPVTADSAKCAEASQLGASMA